MHATPNPTARPTARSGHLTRVGGGVAQTLISTAIGIKYQVGDREAYRDRLAVAIGLLVR